MKTVNEVSRIVGVSVRTLQYYDKIGLLKPSNYSESGYRLYDDTDEVLSGLGKMYAGGGDFTVNIDCMGGEGTAEFVQQAIEIHCK